MRFLPTLSLAAICTTVLAAPAYATVTVEYSGRAPFALGSTVWLLGKYDGVGKSMQFSVNGIAGGNATVGTVNSNNGQYIAPTVMPAGNAVTITASYYGVSPAQTGSVVIPLTGGITPPPPPPPTTPPTGTGPKIAACDVFPSTAIFNTRIDDLNRFPAHARSSAWINSIGSARALHMDFGRNANQADYATYYGIPYNVVDGTSATTTWPTVSFDIADLGNGDGVADESDCAANDSSHTITRACTKLSSANRRFPYPNANILKAEYGSCNDPSQCGDRHVLVVEKGACRLWESYFTYKINGQWKSWSTAAWDMRSNAMRPKTWTSADAAGLPILPLLMRADEASAGEIRHAFRVTFRDGVLDKSFVWPASHYAGGATSGGIPFGAVMRLRSDFVIPSTWTTQARAIATAMKRYGVYVADIGSNAYFTGEPSANWSQDTISQLQRIQMGSFEFVDTRAITGNAKFNPNSYQAAW